MILNTAPVTDVCCQHKIKNKSKFTCIPIGLTQGQFNLNAFKIAEQYKWFQMRSACLMAFCHLYVQDPLNWSSQTINTILINGAKAVKDNYARVKENGPLDCVLNVDKLVAKIRIDDPLYLNAVNSNVSLVETLQRFFVDHQHGLFRCLNFCYLIWKTNGIHFLFDGQGSGSAVNDKNGLASLVCTESLKDVSKLLKTLSSMKPDDCYTISAIKMKQFREWSSNCTEPKIYYAGTSTYTIVSDSFAILSGRFHVGHNGFQAIKQRQSMAVNLMAVIYHAIQPVNSWNGQVLDKIIFLGSKLFHQCKKTPQGEVTIQHLPRQYSVLAYNFKIDYKPYDHFGQLSFSLDEMEKNLLMYLQRALVGGPAATYESVLIQANSLVFAVWESCNYYYMFDAYARNEVGEPTDDQSGKPCVQMHASLESLSNVLARNLNAIVSNEGIVLHGIKVTLVSNVGKAIIDDDLDLIEKFMDDQFWAEMNNFQESSARSEDVICNLDDSSDDDIFMETVGGLKRAVSSIESSASRSTTSFVSDSGASADRTDASADRTDASADRTDASSNDTNSNSHSKVDSDSQVSELKEARPKSPKKRQADEASEERMEYMEQMDTSQEVVAAEQSDENKNEKGKEKIKDEADEGDNGKEQSKKKKKNKNKKKKKNKEKRAKNESQIDGQTKTETKQSLVVVESSSGTETSITKLLTTSFKISDRVLLVTEWGDFFVARDASNYFLLDGCLCDCNALVQINLSELDDSKKLDTIDGIVSKIMDLKICENVTIRSESNDGKELISTTNVDEVKPPYSDVNAPMWELIEEMIELMKTTAKFDKIKTELI